MITITVKVAAGTPPAEAAAMLAALFGAGAPVMSKLDELAGSVASATTVAASAVTLLQGLSQRIADAGADPVRLAALKADLDASTQALADAVVANTPAAADPATP